jgi:Family of unknown function (DUF6884)
MSPLDQPEVGLVACSRTKLSRAAPARELYCSPLFRAARAYAERRYGPDRWLIASARYGLVDPDTVIEPYDMMLAELSPVERSAWAKRVGDTLTARFTPTTVVWLHAGAVYRSALTGTVPNPTRSPLAGLRIGQQLAWYRAALTCLGTSVSASSWTSGR